MLAAAAGQEAGNKAGYLSMNYVHVCTQILLQNCIQFSYQDCFEML